MTGDDRASEPTGDPDSDPPLTADSDADPELVDELLAGDHRALARVITKIENRAPGYRDIVSTLHDAAGGAAVVGVTGSPGAGKSTLVDELARIYRDRGLTVGVIAVDPASPFTGGAVLGDRIRMGSTAGDMDVFFRSMSARGALGGLSTATADAVTALDAFGKDRIVVETVGAGQNEVDVVRTADTVAVLVQPGSGDDVQMLKAGILEIGDVFVVNKADVPGADRTVADLEEMIHLRSEGSPRTAGHHAHDAVPPGESGPSTVGDASSAGNDGDASGVEHDGDASGTGSGVLGDDGDGGDAAGAGEASEWVPPVVETVATAGDGVDEAVAALESHREHLLVTGERAERARARRVEEIRRVLRDDLADVVAAELDRRGGADALAETVLARETDPYTVADEVLDPIRECLERRPSE